MLTLFLTRFQLFKSDLNIMCAMDFILECSHIFISKCMLNVTPPPPGLADPGGSLPGAQRASSL